MVTTPQHLRNLATCVERSATARIGSAQRRNRAESAKYIAAELGTSSFAREATSAALAACMVALAWNANKAANGRRLRHANRHMAALLGTNEGRERWLKGSTLDLQADRTRIDLDAECARTYDEANRLRTQALDVARKLRRLALEIELDS